MKFILPSIDNKKDVLDFYQEFEENNSTCIGFMLHNNYDKWLEHMINRKNNTNLPEGFVRENFYLCYENNVLIGVFSLKFELTDYLFKFGGHIGYAVRPSCRNKGYGNTILNEGLTIAKSYGFKEVLLVVDDDNIASEKIIIKNNGIYLNSIYDNNESVMVKRYNIIL